MGLRMSLDVQTVQLMVLAAFFCSFWLLLDKDDEG